MTLVLDDEQIRRALDPHLAVAAMRRAITDAEAGVLVCPPRVAADLGSGSVVFTVGGRPNEWFGYRSYTTLASSPGAQVVVVQEWHTGAVIATALGNELGARRTGAIGGVAADALARPDGRRLGLIGTGRQAWCQLWAITTVRAIDEVRVWGRDPGRRSDFVSRVRRELGLSAVEATDARDAVADCDMVVLATNSGHPVVDASWLKAGTHVTTLGPKQKGRAEFTVELARRADVITTDSLAQLRAYQPAFILDGTPEMKRVRSLGSVLVDHSPGRRDPSQITLFCSVGLAGTEAALLVEVAERYPHGGGSRAD